MEASGEWIEIRTNTSGLLDGLEVGASALPGSGKHTEGVLSVVVDDSGNTIRKLPTLYFGRAPVFADRSKENILARLGEMVAALRRCADEPTYAVAAVRFADRIGLYAKDMFSRSGFRRRLGRHGLSFARDPFVRLTPDGRFRCDDWGAFDASFVILLSGLDDPAATVTVGKALVPFSIATYRLGGLGASELPRLIRALVDVTGIGGEDARSVADALTTR